MLPFEVQLFSKHFVPLCSKKCAKAVQYFQTVTLLCHILSNRNREKDRKQTKPWVAPLSNKQEDWMILIYFMELSPPFAHRPVSRNVPLGVHYWGRGFLVNFLKCSKYSCIIAFTTGKKHRSIRDWKMKISWIDRIYLTPSYGSLFFLFFISLLLHCSLKYENVRFG